MNKLTLMKFILSCFYFVELGSIKLAGKTKYLKTEKPLQIFILSSTYNSKKSRKKM